VIDAIISDKILTDEDAINHFLNQPFSNGAYRTFKSRLKDKLINCLLLIESSQSNLHDQWKLFYLATMLNKFNLFDYASKILSEVIDFSEKFMVPDLGIMAFKEKINIYKKMEDYISLNDAYIKLENFRSKEQAEYKAELICNKYHDFEVKTLTREMIHELIIDIEELSELLYSNRSSKIFEVFHKLKIYHFISESNFKGLKSFTRDINKNYPDIDLTRIKMTNQYYFAFSLLKCRNFNECLIVIEEELQIIDQGSAIYKKYLNAKINCYLHLNEIAKANILLEKVSVSHSSHGSYSCIFQFYRHLLSLIFDSDPDKRKINDFILQNKDIGNLNINNYDLKSGVIMLSFLFYQRHYSSRYFIRLFNEFIINGSDLFLLRKEKYVNRIINCLLGSNELSSNYEFFSPFDFGSGNLNCYVNNNDSHYGFVPYNLIFDFFLKENINFDHKIA
jgi:hypothetical protein